PVPSRLALGDLVPDSLMSDRGAGPGHREPGGHDGTAGGGGQLRCRVQAAEVDGRTVGAVGGLASGDSHRGLLVLGLGSGGACDGPVTCPAPCTTSPCPHISRVTAFLTKPEPAFCQGFTEHVECRLDFSNYRPALPPLDSLHDASCMGSPRAPRAGSRALGRGHPGSADAGTPDQITERPPSMRRFSPVTMAASSLAR